MILFSLRGKQIQFRQNSKGSVTTSIHNIGEFEAFLQKGKFRKTELSSLMADAFDTPLCLTLCLLMLDG